MLLCTVKRPVSALCISFKWKFHILIDRPVNRLFLILAGQELFIKVRGFYLTVFQQYISRFQSTKRILLIQKTHIREDSASFTGLQLRIHPGKTVSAGDLRPIIPQLRSQIISGYRIQHSGTAKIERIYSLRILIQVTDCQIPRKQRLIIILIFIFCFGTILKLLSPKLIIRVIIIKLRCRVIQIRIPGIGSLRYIPACITKVIDLINLSPASANRCILTQFIYNRCTVKTVFSLIFRKIIFLCGINSTLVNAHLLILPAEPNGFCIFGNPRPPQVFCAYILALRRILIR